MTSKMASKLNPAAPSFFPSMNSSFRAIEKPKAKKPHKYRSKTELWEPPKGWLPFYRCQACREIMSKKEPSKSPQRISSCGHITCAKCIVTSYLVELNPFCPVKDCKMCVNPKQTEPVKQVSILSSEISTPSTTPTKEMTECGFCSGTDGLCNCNDEILTRHYCGDWMCVGDCGVLVCGCIDVCRGRCGMGYF